MYTMYIQKIKSVSFTLTPLAHNYKYAQSIAKRVNKFIDFHEHQWFTINKIETPQQNNSRVCGI